jgi:hypothetical protein
MSFTLRFSVSCILAPVIIPKTIKSLISFSCIFSRSNSISSFSNCSLVSFSFLKLDIEFLFLGFKFLIVKK